jgi:hypothetical protein
MNLTSQVPLKNGNSHIKDISSSRQITFEKDAVWDAALQLLIRSVPNMIMRDTLSAIPV